MRNVTDISFMNKYVFSYKFFPDDHHASYAVGNLRLIYLSPQFIWFCNVYFSICSVIKQMFCDNLYFVIVNEIPNNFYIHLFYV